MVELVLIVCSLLNPQECNIRQPAFESIYGSLRTCLVQGQFAAIRWEEAHPEWEVRRWTCGAPRT